MPLANDLLDLSRQLAETAPASLLQASLRRAVSTAYYALFHLLISEATLNWNRPELRSVLGRVFEHGVIKSASDQRRAELRDELKKNPPVGPEQTPTQHLLTVVTSFSQAQQKRNDADYDTAKDWSLEEVLQQIEAVAAAFRSWSVIREEPIAQAYLVSLLVKKRRSD